MSIFKFFFGGLVYLIVIGAALAATFFITLVLHEKNNPLLPSSWLCLSATAFSGERHIAFERNNAVYLANLDGTNEKKIADGIFSGVSRLMELASRLTRSKRPSETTYVRHMAVVDIAIGKVNVFKDVPSEKFVLPKLDG